MEFDRPNSVVVAVEGNQRGLIEQSELRDQWNDMSFHQGGVWMPRDACLADGEMISNNRIEPKRTNAWIVDGVNQELFPNKKQAVEAVQAVSGTSSMHVPIWNGAATFQSGSGQFADRLFGSEPIRTFNFVDSRNMNLGRKDFGNQFDNGSILGLSVSHTTEDGSSAARFGGVRKARVNQIRDPNEGISVSAGHSVSREETAYSKNGINSISLGASYGNGNENGNPIGVAFSKVDGSFISMEDASKEVGGFFSASHNYNKGIENNLSIGQPYPEDNHNLTSVGPLYGKGDSTVISLNPSFSQGHGNFISMVTSYSKPDEGLNPVAPCYHKGDHDIMPNGLYEKVDCNTTSMGTSYHKAVCNVTSRIATHEKGDSGVQSMAHNYDKIENSTVSLGRFHEEAEANPTGSIIGYELLMSNTNSVDTSKVTAEAGLTGADAYAGSTVNSAPKNGYKTDANVKNKEPKAAKKVSPNSFPSNVKSLLSTGMLDGVPVKYVSWSREKNLKGVIKGTGYVCGCEDCKFAKTLNAYEFERHANCKTKHPNNHIYFENGKTIYAVVQELKNTPQEMLFDTIQDVTGSQINQKNFRSWKASYQAATRELQRIYGRDEVMIPNPA